MDFSIELRITEKSTGRPVTKTELSEWEANEYFFEYTEDGREFGGDYPAPGWLAELLIDPDDRRRLTTDRDAFEWTFMLHFC
ncbi:MAG: hypothetical protein IJ723_03190 [Ruminococcus sp.]|nr:hypothetical protein [Ruminococcus sp.]